MTPDDEAVAEVIALERALLTREVRSSAAALDALLDPEFTETGASGRRWTRAEILAALPAGAGPSPPGPDRIADHAMAGRRLAADVVMLTFETDHEGRRARRVSLWRRSGGRWRLLYHQGTLVPPGRSCRPVKRPAARHREGAGPPDPCFADEALVSPRPPGASPRR